MIDPTKPTVGHATTDSVRTNFQYAKQDIEYMQSQISALTNRVQTLEDSLIGNTGITQEQADLRYLKLVGGVLTGDVTTQVNPTSQYSLVNKRYVDIHSPTVMEYQFNATTTVPPAAGQIRLNNVDQTLATEIYVSKSTAPGVSVDIFLLNISPQILIQDKDDSSKRQIYNTSGPTVDAGTYVTIPVTFDHQGASPLSAQRVLITL